MKKISNLLLLSILLLSACGGGSDLETLQSEKATLLEEIKALESSLKTVESEIAKLDTTSKDEKMELVTTIALDASIFNNYIEVQGKTESKNNVMVTTDMGGLVTGVFVEEGQFVGQGTRLIQLDNSVILNQLSELETGIALAKDVYEKRQRLWDQNIGSEIEFLQAKNNYEALLDKRATVNTQLSKMSIKSPISGYVDVINLNLGEMASPGMPACQVVNNANMEVKVDLPETYLGKVKKGDKILVDLPALGIQKTGKVTSVGQVVNPYNRAFQVIAAIDNKGGDVKPNMLAKVKFTNSTVENSIVIPTSLLQESSHGYFVYTTSFDSTENHFIAEKNEIEVGESYNGNVVVSAGLKAGDILINQGFRNVLDGQIIKIQE